MPQQLVEKKLKEIIVNAGIEKFVSAKIELVESIGLNPKTGKFNAVSKNRSFCTQLRENGSFMAKIFLLCTMLNILK